MPRHALENITLLRALCRATPHASVQVDGAEPKIGFRGLPRTVYPAISVRAPAQLGISFRRASWWASVR